METSLRSILIYHLYAYLKYISYHIQQVNHSLHIFVSLFLWVTGFYHNLPTQPGTKRYLGTTLMYVVSLTQNIHYLWGKCPEYQQNRSLDGLEIWPGSPEEVKNPLTLPET